MLSAPLPFLLAAAVMVAAALAFVVPPLWRRRFPGPTRRGSSNVALYRAELAAVESDRANRLIDAGEHATVTAELARRALEEAVDDPIPQARRGRLAALVVAVLLPLAAVALYDRFGNPSLLGVTAATRASQDEANDERALLAAHLEREPADGRAWVVLARMDFDSGRYAEAALSYDKALAVSPKIARDAGVWCELADALGMANGGRLAGRPTELVAHALRIDAVHPQALEMAGSAAYERADFRAAASYWRQLAARLDAAAPARTELAAAIERADRLARTRLRETAEAPPGRP